MEVFTVKNLNFTYPHSEKKALTDVSLSVNEGEFLVVCGRSGCGKTTLLRHLKTVLAPWGERTGEILYFGKPLNEADRRTQTAGIGFVQQSPENQIVTDKVWHELAFGLESLGCDSEEIRRRVAEMASFFGIQSWFYKNVNELSGGQKQLLNLAAIMVMQPGVLIMDEPTSRLDPIAAGDFLNTLTRINRELGTTVVITEQRLEEVIPMADRVVVMEDGTVSVSGTPEEIGRLLKAAGSPMFEAMPSPMRIWASTDSTSSCPVTVNEGRRWLTDYTSAHELFELPPERPYAVSDETAVFAKELWFRYEREGNDIIRGAGLEVKKGEFLTILGGNGAGKTTFLKILSGALRPYRGKLKIKGRIGLLPQDVQSIFLKKSVREDLEEALTADDTDRLNKMKDIVCLCRLEALLDRHPYDLSGGEQQRAALAKILLTAPDILLLDEPTKGLDIDYKLVFAGILEQLLERGHTIIMISHDIEFCAGFGRRCAMFFDGSIVTEGTARTFFSGNSFYTTSANRMMRSVCPRAVTAEDAIAVLTGKKKERNSSHDITMTADIHGDNRTTHEAIDKAAQVRPAAEKDGAVKAEPEQEAPEQTAKEQATQEQATQEQSAQDTTAQEQGASEFKRKLRHFLALGSEDIVGSATVREKLVRRKPTRRARITAMLILLLVPVTIALWLLFFQDHYFAASLLVVIECMLPVFVIFEGRNPQPREIVVIAVLCALGTAGRAALFMLPNFKPVMAVTIIAGIALGGETGFLTGALTMFISNMLFQQGPWTPWQMFAMGIIGFLAGFVFRNGLLKQKRLTVAAFGALCAIFVYGGIMNPAAAIMWVKKPDWKILLAYYASGIPVDLVHALATFLFLWFGAGPMLEKISRIKQKYGLISYRY